MNLKNMLLLTLSIVLISCNVTHRKKANKIITEFQQEKAIDKRETIFTVETIFKNGQLILTGETDNSELKNELLSSLKNVEVSDQIIILPDSTVGENTFGLINLSVANLRSAPQHSAELATQALLGTPVKILKINNGWYLIQTPDKYISWVNYAGVEPISEKQFADWKQSKKVIFTADNGSVYETDKFLNPVSDITLGNILEETGRNYKAIKVRFPDGRTGFTSQKNWTDFEYFKNTITIDTTQLKKMAEQFMGRPYLWGGTSARAMDCSGFVKILYFMNGIILARDASQQIRYGELVETESGYDNLLTGDLLFFGEKATAKSKEKITHVALSLGGTEYINEAGRMIRNSFNPESKIYSEYRKNSFAGARRVIGSEETDGIQQIKNHPWY